MRTHYESRGTKRKTKGEEPGRKRAHLNSSPWGNFKTKGIDSDPDALVSDLKEHIERIFGVSKSLQILKLKKSGFTLRLVDNDPLSFYEISNKNQIFIERADSSEVKNVSRVRFLQRLGIGSVIKEEPEGEGDEEEKENKQVNDSPGSSMEADRSSKAIDEGKMHRMEIERHFQTVAEGLCYEIQMSDRFDMLESILNQPPQEIQGDEEMNEMYRKTKYTVWSKKGKMGESPVHKVIMLNRITILQEMLANGLDINAESDDGYTPVQLAILCEKAEIFKIFLSHPTFLLNHVTETRGTPLHTAIQNGKFEFIELLLLHGVDTTVRDKKGFTALEVCDSEDIKRFVEAKIKQKETIFKSMPPKPFLCSGYLYKTGIFFKNLRKRWLVINPDEGSISRFKTKEDAKPLEVISLRDVRGVKMIVADWFLDPNFHYFEIHGNQRLVFATATELACKEWIQHIYTSVVYSSFMDELIAKQDRRGGDVMLASVLGELMNKKVQSFEIVDDPASSSPVERKRNTIFNFNHLKQQMGYQKQVKENPNPAPLAAAPLDPSPVSLNSSSDTKVGLRSFEILKKLGAGAFGTVYKVKLKQTGKIYAMKVLKKRALIQHRQLRYAVAEANILKTASYPFILSLHFAFQTPSNMYMVMDYCPGGDLAVKVAEKLVFSEHETRFYVAQILLALDHIHKMDVIYRDLKPENILLDKAGHIKLADFGLSKEGVREADTAKSFCGSPAYLSPEMIKKKGVGKEADIYGLGAVMYEFLVGEPPFFSDNINTIYSNVLKYEVTFPESCSNSISPEAKSLITVISPFQLHKP